MGNSSIHIENGYASYMSHNDRSRQTANSIFTDEENEIWNTAYEAFKSYLDELKIRIQKYTNRTGKKLHPSTITHLSAVVNLNAHHRMKDLQKISDHLEKKFGTKVFQMAIHRDEGHIDSNGKVQKNYHAHIEFLGLDNEGKAIKRTLKRRQLIELQTEVAQLLNMKRGINYTKERKKRPKRLGTYEYKYHKKKEEEKVQGFRRALQRKNKEKETYVSSLTKRANELLNYHLEKRTAYFKEVYEKEQQKSCDLQKKIKELEEKIKLTNEEYRVMVTMADRYLPAQIYEDIRNLSSIKLTTEQEDEIERLKKDNVRLQEEVIEGQSKIEKLKNSLKSDEVVKTKTYTMNM